jgi:PAS domain S-box-containing protein
VGAAFPPSPETEGYDDHCAAIWRAVHAPSLAFAISGIWLTSLIDLCLVLLGHPLPLLSLFALRVALMLWMVPPAWLSLRLGVRQQKLLVWFAFVGLGGLTGALAALADQALPNPFYWSMGFCVAAAAGPYPDRFSRSLGLATLTSGCFMVSYLRILGFHGPALGPMLLLGFIAPLLASFGGSSLDRALREGFQARHLLERARENLAVTLHDIGDGVIVTDRGGAVEMINNKALEKLGWASEEAVGQPLEAIFNPPGVTLAPAPHPIEISLVSRRGDQVWLSLTVSRLEGLILSFQDITERKQAEESRIRASRLESLGLLAGGIAHDFNNLLMAIRGNASLLSSDRTLCPEGRDAVEAIEESSVRAAGLAGQLLTFAKGGVPVRTTQNVAELVMTSAAMALAGSEVKLQTDFPGDLWYAQLDASQMGQAIRNLLLNSVEAMPHGGIVRVTGVNLESAEDSGPMRFVRITFEDQGGGISESVLSHVFDPYFTTKEGHSGLGLTACHSIVARHGGTLKALPGGGGARLELTLPAADRVVERSDLGGLPPWEGGKVLVMDDERPVRRVLSRMLARLGLECVEAEDGRQALQAYREALHSAPFNCVLLDLTVPGGMGGEETLKELLKIDPNVIAIVSSGYANEGILANYQSYGFRGRLTKPFGQEELKEALGGVFSRP